eukprot:scaffold71135_cov30-Phaeocystis_antarctica.AAC.2
MAADSLVTNCEPGREDLQRPVEVLPIYGAESGQVGLRLLRLGGQAGPPTPQQRRASRHHIVARSLPERRIALLMRGASPRHRAPAATCCPEP